jgi:hypothetical protein
MASTLRRVAASGEPFMIVDGVTLLLLVVEIWADEILVTAAAESSDATAALDDTWAVGLREWESSSREARPPAASLPSFSELVAVFDDVGTPYRLDLASGGGSGMWRYDWHFRPGPLDGASSITIQPSGRALPVGGAYTVALS